MASKTPVANICLTLLVAFVIAVALAYLLKDWSVLPKSHFLRALIFFGIIILARLFTKKFLYHDGQVRIKQEK